MKVLVVNAGSSSLKFTLLELPARRKLATGIVERVGLKDPVLRYSAHAGCEQVRAVAVSNHGDALKLICDTLVDPQMGALTSLDEVEAIGHRVVHGGETFTGSVVVDARVKRTIGECAALAPLHNPANLDGIVACEQTFPGTPNVAVFDTAFHQTMPAASFLFALPREYYTKYGIRRYGFHGTSHKYVFQVGAELLQQRPETIKLITCHLGNGCSVAAVKGGEVLETSMGMTPLMGLMMGTRCGDIDPGALLHLLREGKTADQIGELLNKQSGLLGVAGIGSSDMRDIIAQADAGHEACRRALDMFVHRLVFYIGAYFALLDGADGVVFTGGIGENSEIIRARVVEALGSLGCSLDSVANRSVEGCAVISKPGSGLRALVIPTDEELMIALETTETLGRHSRSDQGSEAGESRNLLSPQPNGMG